MQRDVRDQLQGVNEAPEHVDCSDSNHAGLLFSAELFDLGDELGRFVDHLLHCLLQSIPVWIVDEFEEDVQDSSFNLLPVSQGVEQIPELHEELFFSCKPFFLGDVERPLMLGDLLLFLFDEEAFEDL